MSYFFEFITFDKGSEHVFEHVSEHNFAHALPMKPRFSSPKIYTAKGNLSKRWYVYFSFRNPTTGKMERIKNIYGVANKYKTKEARLTVLTAYRKKLLQLLKAGYSPFDDTTDLPEPKAIQKPTPTTNFQTPTNPQSGGVTPNNNPVSPLISGFDIHKTPTPPPNNTKTLPKKTTELNTESVESGMKLKEAFDFALSLKEKTIAERTLNDYQNKTNTLLKWLAEHYPNLTHINQLNKKVVVNFFNAILKKSSARNRNNYRIELGSLLQTMEDNEVIEKNVVKNTPVLRTTPKRNKTYTQKTQEAIFKHLEENDPILLLYIKFISYNLLRPIEVCRLRIKDVNLTDNTLVFKAKNKPSKTKIIPSILLEELPDLTNKHPNHFLFTPTTIGGEWDASETNRRDYFSKRFKKLVKGPFNLGSNYGLYSFRHTFITKLYRELAKTATPFEVKSKLMLITGHSTMTALEKYLRDIDAELPEDYSHLLQT